MAEFVKSIEFLGSQKSGPPDSLLAADPAAKPSGKKCQRLSSVLDICGRQIPQEPVALALVRMKLAVRLRFLDACRDNMARVSFSG